MNLSYHLEQSSSWIIEPEYALERFSIRTYLDWFDQNPSIYTVLKDGVFFPERFLNYLKDKVSHPCSHTKCVLQLLIQGKSDLYRHHCLCYLEHAMTSIDSPPTREKFYLVRTVASILQELSTSLRRDIKHPSWKKFYATLFVFNSAELKWEDEIYKYLFVFPTPHKLGFDTQVALTESLPEPILSHRLANVAISCMKYLHRLHFNTLPTQNLFLASWATRSKQLPWLWRRRIRVTLMRRRRPIWDHDGHKYSSLRKLRRSRQILYSGTTQSHQEQRRFHTWTLDLLYLTLRKAKKCDMLTTALSKPFIPSLAPILFPRRVKRVRKAAAAYLEKVSRRACLGRSDDEPLHS